MHYPTREYQTYAECDQDYVRRTLPGDLEPFWNADNISQATSFWRSENEEIRQSALANSGLYNYTNDILTLIKEFTLISEILMFGQKLSPCKVH